MALVRSERPQAEMEQHLQQCGACREVQQVMKWLGTFPDREPSADLTSRVMSAVREQQQREKHHRWQWRAAAALIMLGAVVWSTARWKQAGADAWAMGGAANVGAPKGSGMQEAVMWFCRNQEADGSWSPTRWGGDARFEVALSALPLLAVLSAEGEKSELQNEVARKAKNYLVSQCDAQGRFGSGFYGSSYTQGIATLALLSYYQHQPDDEVKAALHRALDVIAATQQDEGSWSLAGVTQPDATVTVWQVEALRLATELGWDEMRPHLSLGAKWLSTRRHSATIETQWQASGNFDYFHAYDATLRLRESGDADAARQLTSIREALLRKQSQQGEEMGSWSPDDRWAMVGGRLYSTAMASLALR
jgi:hypothetical protein